MAWYLVTDPSLLGRVVISAMRKRLNRLGNPLIKALLCSFSQATLFFQEVPEEKKETAG